MSAIDRAQALHMLSVLPIDLAILSSELVGMNSGIVAREIKRLKPNVPLMLVSRGVIPDDTLTWADGWTREEHGENNLLQTERMFNHSQRSPLSRQKRVHSAFRFPFCPFITLQII